jgi:hypothetical protein
LGVKVGIDENSGVGLKEGGSDGKMYNIEEYNIKVEADREVVGGGSLH